MKCLSIFVVFLFCISSFQAAGLKLTLYYESLCPACKDFIINQLYPTYKSIGEAFEIELIPFGFTKLEKRNNGTWKFICQHGSEECFENKYQACAVAMHPLEESLEFVYCSKTNEDVAAEDMIKKCSEQSGIKFESLENCYKSGQADDFMVQYGIITLALIPRLISIPAISFNDQFDQNLSNEAQDNLVAVVCKLSEVKPKGCSKS